MTYIINIFLKYLLIQKHLEPKINEFTEKCAEVHKLFTFQM
jgi:hypothetical protein